MNTLTEIANFSKQMSLRKVAGTTATPAIATATGTVATLTMGQRLYLQNLDDVALAVRLGGAASTTVFHFILPACTTALDGTSPPVIVDDWVGIVSVCPMAGTASYVATVLS